MSKLHFTLSRRFNAAFIVVWGLAAFSFIMWAGPRPLLPAVVGCIAGFVAGLLQRGSVKASPALFARASSALEVRRAFMSNRAGKASIATLLRHHSRSLLQAGSCLWCGKAARAG